MPSHLSHNQLLKLLHPLAAADAQHLPFFTEYQYIGIQDIRQHFTDIIKYHFTGAAVV